MRNFTLEMVHFGAFSVAKEARCSDQDMPPSHLCQLTLKQYNTMNHNQPKHLLIAKNSTAITVDNTSRQDLLDIRQERLVYRNVANHEGNVFISARSPDSKWHCGRMI